VTAIEQLRDEIANLHLLADRLARKQPNDEKPKVDLPTLEECEALYHEVRGSAVSFEPWKEGIAAVRALCLATPPRAEVDVELASRAIDNAILLASVYDGVAIDGNKVIADLAALRRALSRATGGA